MPTRRVLLQSMALAIFSPELVAYAQDNKSIEPYFLNYSPVWKGLNWRKDNPVQKASGLSSDAFLQLAQSVQSRMSTPKLMPYASQPVKEIASAITAEVEAVLKREKKSVNEFTRQWMLAEGVCRWALLNIFYDKSQVGPDWISEGKFAYWGKPEVVLKQMPHAATCGGFATTVRDIGRACGLTAYKVDGHWRGLEETGAIPQNHSITAFIFPGDMLVPADVSTARCERQNNQKPKILRDSPYGRVHEWCILPVRPEAWEIFLAHFFTWDGKVNGKQIVNWCGDLQGVHFFHEMPLIAWQDHNISYLKPLEDWLRRSEER